MGAREIQESIRKMAGTDLRDFVSVVVCNVDSVNEDNNTCDCTPIGGDADTQIPSVLLAAENDDGVVVFPEVGSTVVVAFSTRNLVYVFMYSQVSKWVITIPNGEGELPTKMEIKKGQTTFNDGSFGGIVKIDNLKAQYDANIAAIKTAVAAGFTLVDVQLMALGQPGGSATAFNSAATSISNLNKTPLENDKVKHGI